MVSVRKQAEEISNSGSYGIINVCRQKTLNAHADDLIEAFFLVVYTLIGVRQKVLNSSCHVLISRGVISNREPNC